MARFVTAGGSPVSLASAAWGETSLAAALIGMSFRQQLIYRGATVGGLVASVLFGVLGASVYGAVYAARGGAPVGPLDRESALTYVWLAQALLVPTMVWGSWEIATAIRSGDVAVDLIKPFSFVGYWLSRDIGRAIAAVLFRFTPTVALGVALYPIAVPDGIGRWLVFGLGLWGAVATSFAVRFLVNMVSFWWNDVDGLRILQVTIVGLLSGFLMPLDFYPVWLRVTQNALPFRGIVMTPIDLWLGHGDPVHLLLAQLGWLAVLLPVASWMFRRAVREMVVQGG